ncbi:MAG: tRNA epoxyqueuosine(34) reductase QueG [Acidobacteriaceae bacterium]|nr:tRNA epoxyqueuosine(34) reductase QueG [Acidobacteriaceae bacterium]
MAITAAEVKQLAQGCGFELAGVAAAVSSEDFERFETWRTAGMAGQMSYLTDRRGDLRADPKNLLPEARSIICVGKLYNTDAPHTSDIEDSARGWISRYAWGSDYHHVVRKGLERLVEQIKERCPEPFQFRICVDTAPLLERSYAQAAGLGWIGKNTCLINQRQGSWFFLGELLLSIPFDPDSPAPFRCGSCTRCIDACPTQAIVPNSKAIVPNSKGGWALDGRLCISYLTIENRGEIPGQIAPRMANHLFGCDICQDVCPWNRRGPITSEPAFAAGQMAPELTLFADLSEEEFRTMFRHSPVWRAKYRGFLRNVAVALGNSSEPESARVLEKLAAHPDPLVATTASQALFRFKQRQTALEDVSVVPCGSGE